LLAGLQEAPLALFGRDDAIARKRRLRGKEKRPLVTISAEPVKANWAVCGIAGIAGWGTPGQPSSLEFRL
jgi:hypothetical protein